MPSLIPSLREWGILHTFKKIKEESIWNSYGIGGIHMKPLLWRFQVTFVFVSYIYWYLPLEINTAVLKIATNFLKIILIGLFCINIKTHYEEELFYKNQNNLMAKGALVSMFLNVFNIWLNRRQLDSYIGFGFNLLPYHMSCEKHCRLVKKLV